MDGLNKGLDSYGNVDTDKVIESLNDYFGDSWSALLTHIVNGLDTDSLTDCLTDFITDEGLEEDYFVNEEESEEDA